MTIEQIKNPVSEIIKQYFPADLQQALLRYEPLFGDVQEIRCRVERPLMLRLKQGGEQIAAEHMTAAQMQHVVSRISQGSAYAWAEEFRQGYLTLQGGHRVGMVGKGVLEDGQIRTLKQISGLNFRIARSVPGAADKLVERVAADGRLHNTLLISPPGCGKTTMLRDLVRQLSDGIPHLHKQGFHAAVVDERSELAGCVNGIPQLDVGSRTDVLDACPKSEGIRMLIRSMGPQVVAVDEIGTAADVQALEEALQSGVCIITTVHGSGVRDLLHHPTLSPLIKQQFFSVIVSLHWKNGQVAWQEESGGWL